MHGSSKGAARMRDHNPENRSLEIGPRVGGAPGCGERISRRGKLRGRGKNEAEEFTPGGGVPAPEKNGGIHWRAAPMAVGISGARWYPLEGRSRPRKRGRGKVGRGFQGAGAFPLQKKRRYPLESGPNGGWNKSHRGVALRGTHSWGKKTRSEYQKNALPSLKVSG